MPPHPLVPWCPRAMQIFVYPPLGCQCLQTPDRIRKPDQISYGLSQISWKAGQVDAFQAGWFRGSRAHGAWLGSRFGTLPSGVMVPILVIAIAIRLGIRALRVFEVGMVARLLRRDAARGIVDQHHLQQVKTDVVEVGAERLRLVPDPLGERRLEIGVRRDAGPHVVGGRAQLPTMPVSHRHAPGFGGGGGGGRG